MPRRCILDCQCSASCGGGIKTREVRCRQVLSMGQAVDQPSTKCPTRRPNSRRRCNKRRCPNATQLRSGINKIHITWDDHDNDVLDIGRRTDIVDRSNEINEVNEINTRLTSPANRLKSKEKKISNSLSLETNNIEDVFKQRKRKPSIRSQPNQKYLQKKYMKKVKLKVCTCILLRS